MKEVSWAGPNGIILTSEVLEADLLAWLNWPNKKANYNGNTRTAADVEEAVKIELLRRKLGLPIK